MTPLEMIRHNWLGSTLSETLCFDPACHSSIGPKILKQIFNGYGEKATELSQEEQQSLKDASDNHLKLFPEHRVSIFIGHNENVLDGKTGYSKVEYEYHAPWSKKF